MKKEAIALLVTDTHLKESNFEAVKSIYQQACALCEQKGIKRIFDLGDRFYERKHRSFNELDYFDEILETVGTYNLDFYQIAGNHDKVDYKSLKSYLKPFKERMFLVQNATHVKVGQLIFSLFPFIDESIFEETFKEEIDFANENKTIALCHQAFNGARNNDGSIVYGKLSVSLFKNAKFVFCGHYHDEQKIGDNFLYMGSSLQHNFGENENKGFIIVYSDGSYEKVLSEFPRFRKVYLTLEQSLKISDSQLEQHFQGVENKRVIIECSDIEFAQIDKKRFEDAGIKVKCEKIVVEQKESEKVENFTTLTNDSIIKNFETFVKENEIQNSETGLKFLISCF